MHYRSRTENIEEREGLHWQFRVLSHISDRIFGTTDVHYRSCHDVVSAVCLKSELGRIQGASTTENDI